MVKDDKPVFNVKEVSEGVYRIDFSELPQGGKSYECPQKIEEHGRLHIGLPVVPDIFLHTHIEDLLEEGCPLKDVEVYLSNNVKTAQFGNPDFLMYRCEVPTTEKYAKEQLKIIKEKIKDGRFDLDIKIGENETIIYANFKFLCD